MNFSRNMEFKMQSSFIPNISNSEILKIVEVSKGSIVVQMQNSNCRGVFPLDSFQYWVKKSSLIQVDEHEELSS